MILHLKRWIRRLRYEADKQAELTAAWHKEQAAARQEHRSKLAELDLRLRMHEKTAEQCRQFIAKYAPLLAAHNMQAQEHEVPQSVHPVGTFEEFKRKLDAAVQQAEPVQAWDEQSQSWVPELGTCVDCLRKGASLGHMRCAPCHKANLELWVSEETQ